MSPKREIQLWPSGKEQWKAYAAKIEAEKAAERPVYETPADEPLSPEEEETLF